MKLVLTTLFLFIVFSMGYIARGLNDDPVSKKAPFVLVTKSGAMMSSGNVWITTINNGKIRTEQLR